MTKEIPMPKSEIPRVWRRRFRSFELRHLFVIRHSDFVIKSMFTSRHIKHSRLLLRHARKYLRYKHDKLSDVDREQIVSEMQTLIESLRSRDRENIHGAAETLDKT